MHNSTAIAADILWVGGGDRRLALFENLFPLENGITYNSYLILDEKTALLDTVDSAVSRQFIENVTIALDGRALDYLIISHMEPDHCANIEAIIRLHPEVTLIGNAKTFQLLAQFYGAHMEAKRREVKDGDTLNLGAHSLRFLSAPMVHWPEVMFTYEEKERILFSADAFGTFGGYDGNLFSDEMDYERLHLDEARRYYANIVGKFGPQVQAALRKAEGLTIDMIASLHGPILRGADVALMLEKYQRWSRYQPEMSGVMLAYASMYGNTENAAHVLANRLAENGVRNLRLLDVSKAHFSTVIAESFRYSHLVFAAPTYNMGLFSAMELLLTDMKALNLQGRKAAILANGSWAPAAHTIMQRMLAEMKDIQLIDEPFLIKSALTAEQAPQLEALAAKIAASVKAEPGE